MKKTIIILIVIIAVIFLITWFDKYQQYSQIGPGELDPMPVPEFNLKDFSGNAVSLIDLKGKPAVINSWAVWCPFCKKELDDFAIIQEEFGDKISVIAIDRDESLSKQKGFTDSIGVTNRLTFLQDPGDTFYRSIGGFSMPETLFVNARGEIVFHKRGVMSLSEIRQRTQQLLE